MTNLKQVYSSEWFVSKGDNKFGPFNYFDIIRMLQEKVVFGFDFGWSAGMDNWIRLAEIEVFKQDFVAEVTKDKEVQKLELFLKRKHKRISSEFECVAHNNSTAWKGVGVEMSAGGAGIIMNNAMIVPGDSIYLHVKKAGGLPPFNALCEVVAKEYSKEISRSDMPVKYGLKFTTINEEAQQDIKEFISKRA